ncbi:carbohydrate ABC transporter permease [Streptomyces sp. NPDC004647]|uniref:carbohydrate ABC transporter permease n=1 Tax=Streptomyces sp. NPDC004647 TaxID=3154671 RepID=UPI0033ABB395
MSTHTGARTRRRISRTGYNLLGLLAFAVMAFPVYWLVKGAVSPRGDLYSYDLRLWPSEFTLEGFRTAVGTPTFWDNLRASVVVGLCTVVIAIAIGLLAAYAIARFGFYGRKGLMVALLAVQMVPQTALIIPLYIQLNAFDGVDQLWGVILVYMSFILPYTVWMLRGFIVNIPKELEESAMVDGCTRMGAFRKVVFPLVAPGLVATSIYALIQAWNEYVLAYVLLSSNDKQTLPIWLVGFATSRGVDYGAQMAGATLIALPVVIFFLIVQRKVAAGLTSGAVKG